MRDRLTSFATCLTLLVLALPGCKKEDETPVAVQPTQQQQQYQQPVGAQPGYQQPVGAAPAAAAPAAAPAAAAPAAAAASPTPGPLAPPCTVDAGCTGAKCNVAAGKCQYPCGSNNDCQPGWACNLALGQVCTPTGQIAPAAQ